MSDKWHPQYCPDCRRIRDLEGAGTCVHCGRLIVRIGNR